MNAPLRSSMPRIEPFFREAGKGPGVVCLHANASSSSQWRGLMELLAPDYRVPAPDLYDCGKGPRWPSDRFIALRDEAALYEPPLFSLVEADAPAPNAADGIRRGVARLLAPALPKAELVEFDNLGHMAPVTHPEQINRTIRDFLQRIA